MSKPIRIALLGLLLLVYGWGCSGGSDLTTTTPVGNTVIVQNDDFVLRSDLDILPSDGSVVVEALDDDQVVLTGTVPEIVPGSALMMNTGPQQFIRRVVSVSTADGRTVVQTTPGSLLDVFETADISQSEVVGPEMLRQAQPELDGVTLGEPVQSRTIQGGWSLPVNFKSAPINDRNGNLVATIDGQLNLTFGFQQELRFNASKFLNPPTTLEKLRLVPFVNATGHLDVKAQGSGDFEQETKVASLGRIPLASLGPCTVTAGVDVYAYANGRFSVTGTTTLDGEAYAEFGLQAIDGNFSVVNPPPEVGFRVTPPDAKGTAEFSCSLARPSISIGVLGLGDAFIKADAFRAGVKAEFTTTPSPGYRIGAEAVFSVLAGAVMKVGPYGFPPFAIPEYTIFNQTVQALDFRLALGDPVFIADRQDNPPSVGFIVPLKLGNDPRPGEYRFVGGLSMLNVPFPVLFLPLYLPLDWSTSTNVIELVDTHGAITIVRAKRPGTARVTGTFPGGPQITIDYTVPNAPIASLRIEPPGAKITTRQTLQGRAIATYSDGVQVDVTDFVDWATSDQNIAVVTPRGFFQPRQDDVQARGGLMQSGSIGVVQLMANFQGQNASVPIDLESPRVLQLDVLNRVSSINPTDFRQLTAVAFLADGTSRIVTNEVDWSSDDSFVATVSSTGELLAGDPGQTRIRARLNGLEYSFPLSVGQPFIRSLAFDPESLSLAAGKSQNVRILATFNDNDVQDVTRLAKIKVLLPEFADFSNGQARAHQPGASLIYATFGGRAAFMLVTVLPEQSRALFVANTGASQTLATVSVGQDGSLKVENETPGGGRISDVIRFGDFVVATVTGLTVNRVQVLRYDAQAQDTNHVNPPFNFPTADFQDLPIVKTGDNTFAVLQPNFNQLWTFSIDTDTGSVTQSSMVTTDSPSPLSLAARLGPPNYLLVGNHGDVSVYRVNSNNTLTPAAGSPFNNPVAAAAAADLLVLNDVVYTANITDNSLSRLNMDPATGVLTAVPGSIPSGGDLPTALLAVTLPPAAQALYVANAGSSNVNGFQLQGGGALTQLAGFPVSSQGGNPHKFAATTLADGDVRVYLTTSNRVTGYLVDLATGLLTPLLTSPFDGFDSPDAITN